MRQKKAKGAKYVDKKSKTFRILSNELQYSLVHRAEPMFMGLGFVAVCLIVYYLVLIQLFTLNHRTMLGLSA